MKILRPFCLALSLTIACLGLGNAAYANSPATFATTTVVKNTSFEMPVSAKLAWLHCGADCAAWIAATAGAVAAGAAVATAVAAFIDSSSSSSSSGSIYFAPPSRDQYALAQQAYVREANHEFDR